MILRRIARWSIVVVAALLLFVVGLVWFGPVTVGDKRVLLDFILGRGIAPPSTAEASARLQVASGFKLTVYSTDVPLARWPLATATGDLIIARTRADEVVLLERDRNGDGRPDAVRKLLTGLHGPHGLALHDGWLFVGEATGIGR